MWADGLVPIVSDDDCAIWINMVYYGLLILNYLIIHDMYIEQAKISQDYNHCKRNTKHLGTARWVATDSEAMRWSQIPLSSCRDFVNTKAAAWHRCLQVLLASHVPRAFCRTLPLLFSLCLVLRVFDGLVRKFRKEHKKDLGPQPHLWHNMYNN